MRGSHETLGHAKPNSTFQESWIISCMSFKICPGGVGFSKTAFGKFLFWDLEPNQFSTWCLSTRALEAWSWGSPRAAGLGMPTPLLFLHWCWPLWACYCFFWILSCPGHDKTTISQRKRCEQKYLGGWGVWCLPPFLGSLWRTQTNPAKIPSYWS